MLRRALTIGAALVVVAAATAAATAGFTGDDSPEKEAPRPLPTAREDGRSHAFDLETVADGLVRPTWAGVAPGEPDALYVLEQPGRVLRLAGDRRTTVLDLRDRVKLGGEQGLLAAAFHPGFAENGRLVLHYSDRRGDTRVVEVEVGGGHRVTGGERVLLEADQPEENHNGGAVVFGPDGRLHLGLGDGGGAFDPRGNGQDLDERLGKLLAADVDAGGAPRWEVVAYGLRNPWRFSFDPALGEVWIGDVGQDSIEEVDRVYLEPDEPPKNFGWSAYEGTRVTRRGVRALRGKGDVVWPVAAYGRRDGCSVTGGIVYRGARLPRLSGRYLYGDFCTGTLWTLRPTPNGRADDLRRERARAPQLTHIGTDADGEPLLVSADGKVRRAVAPGP